MKVFKLNIPTGLVIVTFIVSFVATIAIWAAKTEIERNAPRREQQKIEDVFDMQRRAERLNTVCKRDDLRRLVTLQFNSDLCGNEKARLAFIRGESVLPHLEETE